MSIELEYWRRRVSFRVRLDVLYFYFINLLIFIFFISKVGKISVYLMLLL